VVRKLSSVLVVGCLLIAGLTTAGVASARPARPALKVSVDWPTAPVRTRTVTVHVTRADARPTIARLQTRYGSGWMTVKEKVASARTFVFQTKPTVNRTMLRVVLPQRHVASRGFAAPQPAPLVRRVSYADGPVYANVRGQAVTLLFAGRRGQDVQLTTNLYGNGECSYTRLRGPFGLVARGRQGLWHLPRTGTYRFEVVPCYGYGFSRASLDVTLARLVPLTLDAPRVVLARRPGVNEIGVVTLPAGGRVLVRAWQSNPPAWSRVTSPTGSLTTQYSAAPIHLGAGMTPGRYLFQPSSESMQASASSPIGTTVTPEGPAATLGDDGVAGRERSVTFTGTAGTFVYPEPALPRAASGGDGSLTGPDGTVVRDWNFNQGWLLPSDGTYTLHVTPTLTDALNRTPVTMRVRQAVSVPMAYDTPTRFTVTQPDRWLFAQVAVPTPPYTHLFTASGSTMSGAWEAVLGLPSTNYCPPGPGPNGCGENFYSSVNQDVAETGYRTRGGDNPNIVVLRPGAGVTGGVDLAVRPR
jgi:hypothetical protein